MKFVYQLVKRRTTLINDIKSLAKDLVWQKISKLDDLFVQQTLLFSTRCSTSASENQFFALHIERLLHRFLIVFTFDLGIDVLVQVVYADQSVVVGVGSFLFDV